MLLWQPVKVQDRGKEDEWMYELQAMQKYDGHTLTPKLLHDVFLKARRGDLDLSQAIHALKDQYAMTPQDKACLALLDKGQHEMTPVIEL